jgi:hypothetical protein
MWTPNSGTNGFAGGPTQNLSPNAVADNDSAQRDRLNQIFNTALVSTRSEAHLESANEIHRLMGEPALAAILQSIQLLAGEQGTSEMEAARDIIRTFRKMDQLWTEYLVAEGVERLKLST